MPATRPDHELIAQVVAEIFAVATAEVRPKVQAAGTAAGRLLLDSRTAEPNLARIEELLRSGQGAGAFRDRPARRRRDSLRNVRSSVGGTASAGDGCDDAVAVLDAQGWSSAHVVGVSQGGMIAQTMASRHPDRVRTLTCLSSGPAPRRSGPHDPPDRRPETADAIPGASLVTFPGMGHDLPRALWPAVIDHIHNLTQHATLHR